VSQATTDDIASAIASAASAAAHVVSNEVAELLAFVRKSQPSGRYDGPRPQVPPGEEDARRRKQAIHAYLCCRPGDALTYLRPVVRWLVTQEGGVRSNGALLAQDAESGLWVMVACPKDTSSLASLVETTRAAPLDGGQGSEALLRLLERVARNLYAMAHHESELIASSSTVNRMVVGDDEEEVGERRLHYVGVDGAPVSFSPSALQSNLLRLQPACASAPWLLEMAFKPDAADSITFDALDGTIRSSSHAIIASPSVDGGHTLSLRQLKSSDRMLLDAGHDLSSLSLPAKLPAGVLAELEDVKHARKAITQWMGEHTDWFLCSIAERLLLRVRKEAHVFEAISDRGKTTLMTLLLATLGTYARRMPNSAVSGENKRMAPTKELTLSRAGVRFLMHDEVDRVDWEFLKQQSNAAPAEEWGVGMSATLSVAHKATRILTRNATRVATTVRAAPQDCRRKIVHWTSDTLHKPPDPPDPDYDEKLACRVRQADPTLARGVFLAALEVFQRLRGERGDDIPGALLAGDDLRPAEEGGLPPAANETDAALTTLTLCARRVFHELYRASSHEEGGTTAAKVHELVTADERLPRFFRALPGATFVQDVLRAGEVVEGDPTGVPSCDRSHVGAIGSAKRTRVANVLLCLRRVT